MPLPTVPITDKSLLQEVWRQGYLRLEGIQINGRTPTNASRLRFSLYNAVKQYRRFPSEADEVLQQALNHCEIGLSEDGTVLTVRRKLNNEVAQELFKQLDLLPEQIQSVENLKAEESIRRITDSLEKKADTILDKSAVSPGARDSSGKYGARGH